MFDKHSRGDLMQYLEARGYCVSDREDTEALRLAAKLDSEARMFRDSQLVRDVAKNAERMLRMGTVNSSARHDTIEQEFNSIFDDDGEGDGNPFFGW